MTTLIYLQSDLASHYVLTRTTHTNRSGVARGSPEGRADQMTHWLSRSGEIMHHVSEKTNCGA